MGLSDSCTVKSMTGSAAWLRGSYGGTEPNRIHGGAYIVHAEDGHSAHSGNRRAGQGAGKPMLRFVDAQDAAQESFARGADQNRLTEGDEPIQAFQDHQVVLDAFAEPQTGIENDAPTVDAASHRNITPFPKES
jgi:hypothetical protein